MQATRFKLLPRLFAAPCRETLATACRYGIRTVFGLSALGIATGIFMLVVVAQFVDDVDVVVPAVGLFGGSTVSAALATFVVYKAGGFD